MQTIDPYTLSALTAAIASAAIAAYLIFKWHSQPTRMYTDLPFVFGLSFMMQAINMLIQGLALGGILPDTLEVLRLRALVIAGTAFPLLSALLFIWLPRQKRHHWKIILALLIYWLTVTVLAPDSQILMGLLVPILLVLMIGLIVTFAITWKTGRLKEVRSDLMILALLLIIVSQITRLRLVEIGAGPIADLMNVIATLMATIALLNPWYKRTTNPA